MSGAETERMESPSRRTRRDPGASRYGNFINYYTFHSAEERTRQLPRGVLRPTRDRKFVGLDVGCNAGDLTMLLEKYLGEEVEGHEVSLLGIDIDEVLIERAREKNSSRESVTFETLDATSGKSREVLLGYLKKFDRERFDVAFCFSITMWIHANHGDDGLVRFLETVCSVADAVVVEPQSWKCYRNASRRLRRAGDDDFPLLNSLKLTGDVAGHIDRIVRKCSFSPVAVTDANEWGRKLLVYERVK